mmetsp:Transcript_58063/g.108753  ORF Transcript_58063/g.108753 Transcript_58063/m.108753 type:complete len:123 (+) Transcript_58063:97-465(+)
MAALKVDLYLEDHNCNEDDYRRSDVTQALKGSANVLLVYERRRGGHPVSDPKASVIQEEHSERQDGREEPLINKVQSYLEDDKVINQVAIFFGANHKDALKAAIQKILTNRTVTITVHESHS